MKTVTVSSKNGISVTPNETIAINLRNIVYYYQNSAGYAVVRYVNEATSNWEPESLTLTVNKAAVDSLVATDSAITLLTVNVFDTTTGVTTATSFNEKYLISLKDTYVNISGTKTAAVAFIFADGQFKNKTKYINSTLATLVASNAADFLTFTIPVVGSTSSINVAAKTVSLTAPFGTSTTQVATWTRSGTGGSSSTNIGVTAQTSAATSNSFATPVVYALVASDGITSKNWTVSLTVAAE
jgi:hypothetical protein